MSKNIFIVGTGTDIGKTYVTALIVKKLKESGAKAAYYKAAVSGNERNGEGELIPGDPLHIKQVSGTEQPIWEMCPYIYERAYSPHLAAEIEGNPVDMDAVRADFSRICEKYDYVTMEGSGGILCPIRFDNTELWLADIIRELGLGCLLVADSGLGTINSVGLTAYYMKEQGIPLKGIIFNRYIPGDVIQEDNIKMCEYITGVKVITKVRNNDRDLDISPEEIKALYE